MTLFAYTIVGLAVTWALYVAYMYVATRAGEGRPVRPLYGALPGLAETADKALVYCFSPQCGPCRPMSKEVDILRGGGAPVFKLDVTEHPEASRELGIRATPTLILVKDGNVTADYMRRLLDEAT